MSDKETLNKLYRQVREIVTDAFVKYDPIGLGGEIDLSSEYASEIDAVTSKILQCRRESHCSLLKGYLLELLDGRFEVKIDKTICRKMAFELDGALYYLFLAEELRETECLKDKVSCTQSSILLQIHDFFRVEWTGAETFINGKFFGIMEEQDVQESFCALCEDDCVYVQYRCRQCVACRLRYFRKIASSKFNYDKLRHKRNIEFVFDKNGRIN